MDVCLNNYGNLHERLIHQIVNNINYNYYQFKPLKKPFIVLFISTRQSEGKTQMARLIAKEMRKLGEPTLVLSPNTGINNYILDDKDEDNIVYNLPNNFCDIDLNNNVFKTSKKHSEYRYIFFEIPSIIGSDLPIKIIKNVNLSFLIIKSSRNWNKADEMAIDTYSNINKQQISAILNGAHVDALETIIGEIPKKRSLIRILIIYLILKMEGAD